MAQPEPQRDAGTAPRPLFAEIVARDGLIVAGCLALMLGLAWWWLIDGAAMPAGGTGPDMAGMGGMAAPRATGWTPGNYWGYYWAAFAMWAVMMVAMMLPSAAPMILLHELFSRRNGLGLSATWAFAGSYLGLWIVFAAIAGAVQASLVANGLVDAASLAFGDHRLTALLLVIAAAWQISPLKRSCLTQCQAPFRFLMRHWKPGAGGAAAMGLRHGLYCIGCCWLLMALLFVGGVMNLAWIALLTLAVVAEKYAPADLRADRFIAALMVMAAALAWWQGAR